MTNITGSTGPNYTQTLSAALNAGNNISATNITSGYGYYSGSLTAGNDISPSNSWMTSSVTSSIDLNTKPSLRVNGDANFDGEVIIKGVRLDDRLSKIEERLCILRPNEDLENKWDELKALGERYRELERDIIDKESMWNIIKK